MEVIEKKDGMKEIAAGYHKVTPLILIILVATCVASYVSGIQMMVEDIDFISCFVMILVLSVCCSTACTIITHFIFLNNLKDKKSTENNSVHRTPWTKIFFGWFWLSLFVVVASLLVGLFVQAYS